MNYRRQSFTFQFVEDPSSKIEEVISKTYHEVFLLMKFLQTKPKVKIMQNNYYDLYYTDTKNKDDKEIVDDESDYINYDNIIVPNYDIGIKPGGRMIKWRKMRTQINHFKFFFLYK